MSVEEKVSWIEKGLDRNTTTIDALSRKMTTIETYFKVVFAIAAILGISGAFLFSKISSVSNEIAQYKTDVGNLQAQIEQLENSAKNLQKDVQGAKDDALKAIGSIGEEQKDALASVIASITPSQLANGMLKGSIKNILVKNCGGKSCDCPVGWSKARYEGGNGDLNRGAKGDFIYICVQYY